MRALQSSTSVSQNSEAGRGDPKSYAQACESLAYLVGVHAGLNRYDTVLDVVADVGRGDARRG